MIKLAQNIIRLLILGFCVFITLSVFFPVYSYDDYGTVNKYFYDVLEPIYLFMALIPLALGTGMLFSKANDRSMAAEALIVICCMFCLLFCTSLTQGSEKKAGFYLLLIFTILQLVAVIAYIVIGMVKSHHEKNVTAQGVAVTSAVLPSDGQIEVRLKKLYDLKENEVITEEEYYLKRAEVIADLRV